MRAYKNVTRYCLFFKPQRNKNSATNYLSIFFISLVGLVHTMFPMFRSSGIKKPHMGTGKPTKINDYIE